MNFPIMKLQLCEICFTCYSNKDKLMYNSWVRELGFVPRKGATKSLTILVRGSRCGGKIGAAKTAKAIEVGAVIFDVRSFKTKAELKELIDKAIIEYAKKHNRGTK